MKIRSRLRTTYLRLGELGLPLPYWHRRAVGGAGDRWEEIGRLQFEFLLGEGLEPQHHLLDMGCGSLRGGVHFIRYLEAGHYFGVDRSSSLLRRGESELKRAGVTGRNPTLVARSNFVAADLGPSFDFAIAQSLFTHLTFNSIVRCVAEVSRALRPGGRFFATFFASPGPRLRTAPMLELPITAKLDADPYYYDPALFSWLCEGSDLACEYRGEWDHPVSQHMLIFTKQPRGQ
jgi:SAM-dependent methyltransferase